MIPCTIIKGDNSTLTIANRLTTRLRDIFFKNKKNKLETKSKGMAESFIVTAPVDNSKGTIPLSGLGVITVSRVWGVFLLIMIIVQAVRIVRIMTGRSVLGDMYISYRVMRDNAKSDDITRNQSPIPARFVIILTRHIQK